MPEILTDVVSDDLPVFCAASMRRSNENSLQTYTYRKINEKSLHRFETLISFIDLENVFAEKNPDVVYDVFLNEIWTCNNSAFPVKHSKNRKKNIRKQWLTAALSLNVSNKKNFTTLLSGANQYDSNNINNSEIN